MTFWGERYAPGHAFFLAILILSASELVVPIDQQDPQSNNYEMSDEKWWIYIVYQINASGKFLWLSSTIRVLAINPSNSIDSYDG